VSAELLAFVLEKLSIELGPGEDERSSKGRTPRPKAKERGDSGRAEVLVRSHRVKRGREWCGRLRWERAGGKKSELGRVSTE
jgi:hypothetical protein